MLQEKFYKMHKQIRQNVENKIRQNGEIYCGKIEKFVQNVEFFPIDLGADLW